MKGILVFPYRGSRIDGVKYFALIILGMFPSPAIGRVIFVQAGVDPEGALAGEEWKSSTYFHRALEISESGDQIWLKGGRYSPLEGRDPFNGPSPYFVIPPGVGVFGGFSGDEMELSERNLDQNNQTILTGDFDGDDIVDPVTGITLTPEGIVGTNANTLVRVLGGGRATVLDGVTLTGAKRVRCCSGFDTALSINRGSPVIRNCTFVGNDGAFAGAIFLDESPEAVIANCLFADNEGEDSAGAIQVNLSSPLIVNCTFRGNEVDGDQAALAFSAGGSGMVANCIFEEDAPAGGEFVDRTRMILSNSNYPPILIGNIIQGDLTPWLAKGGLIDGGANLDVSPRFITGTNQVRADSPAINHGWLQFLPPDSSDLDGDNDSLETLPFDQAGRSYGLGAFVNRRCDAGCFQYDWFNADSDLDGFLDSFEREVTGNALNLYIPRVTDLSIGGEGVFLEFEYYREIRDFTDFVFEAASALSGPWTDVEGKRIRSAAISDVDGSETWELFPEPEQKFFRVRTVPES